MSNRWMIVGLLGIALLLGACNRATDEELTEGLNETREELTESREELNELETRLAEANAEAVTFQRQAEVVSETTSRLPEVEGISALRVRVGELEREANDLITTQQRLGEQFSAAREELAASRDNLRSLTDAQIVLEEELADARAEAAEARTRAENVDDITETQDAALEVARSSGQAETRILEERLELVSTERDEALEETNNLRETLSTLQDGLSSYRNSQTTLEQELVNLRSNAAALPDEEQLDALDEQISALQSSLFNTREELRSRPTNEQVEALNEQVESLQAQLDNRPTQRQLEALQSRIEAGGLSPALGAATNGADGADGATVAELESRLINACEQLSEAFTDVTAFPYCADYILAPEEPAAE